MKTYQESQGASVQLALTATIEAGDAVYVNGWLGIAADDGVSGDIIAVTIKEEEYQFELGGSLNPDVGAIVYVTLSGVTGHTIPTSALSLSSGAGKRALFKTTAARFASATDAAVYYVTGILLREEV